MCPSTGARLPFLFGRGELGGGAYPAYHAPASESACALVRAGFHTPLYPAGGRNRVGRQHPECVPTGAGAHRRSTAHPLWHRAHRVGTPAVVVQKLPYSGEARPLRLVAFRSHRHRLWRELVSLYRPAPCSGPGADCRKLKGRLARGDLDADLCSWPGVPFLLVGFLVDRASPFLRRIRRSTALFSTIGGVILILLGIVLLTGLFSNYG